MFAKNIKIKLFDNEPFYLNLYSFNFSISFHYIRMIQQNKYTKKLVGHNVLMRGQMSEICCTVFDVSSGNTLNKSSCIP